MNEWIRFKIENDSQGLLRITTYGFDFGPLLLFEQFEECGYTYQVWHSPAHTEWSGVGQRDTVPSYYYLVWVRSGKDEYGRSMAVQLVEIAPGRRWREVPEIMRSAAIVDARLLAMRSG